MNIYAKLNPSKHYLMLFTAAKEILFFKDSFFRGVAFWVALPVLPFALLGMYLAEIPHDKQ